MYLEVKSHHDSQAIHVGWTNVAKTCIDNYEAMDEKQKLEKSKVEIHIIVKKV